MESINHSKHARHAYWLSWPFSCHLLRDSISHCVGPSVDPLVRRSCGKCRGQLSRMSWPTVPNVAAVLQKSQPIVTADCREQLNIATHCHKYRGQLSQMSQPTVANVVANCCKRRGRTFKNAMAKPCMQTLQLNLVNVAAGIATKLPKM